MKKAGNKIGAAVGFFFILLLLHLTIQTGWGDDAVFAQDTKTLEQFLSWRYHEWSSRLIVEVGMKLLLGLPDWIWRLFNILMVLLLIWIVADLFGIEKKGTKLQAQFFFFVLLVFVPIDSVCEVGWVTTTLNYLWPLTLGFVAMRPLKHWLGGETCPRWEYLVCPLFLVCAANTEQGVAVLLGAYLLAGVVLIWRKRKLPFFYFVMLLLLAASIVFILSTPGNARRYVVEIQKWFPAYAGFSFFEKFLMGFIDTMNYYFSAGGEQTNFVMAPFTVILFVSILRRRGEKGFWLKTLIAFWPFAFYWGVGLFGNWWLLNKGFSRGGHIVGLFGMNRCLPVGAGVFDFLGWLPYSWGMVSLQAGVYLVLIICVALTIFFLHGKSAETLFELSVLGIGLMSRVGMGFSPTVYASGARTALYCSVAVLIVSLRNLQTGCWKEMITILRNKVLNWIVFCMLLMTIIFCPALSVRAATVYVSDGILYDEGYIFVGESHMHVASFAMQEDALGNIPGLDGVRYTILADSSIVSNERGEPGTFTMSGNLFFVYEGTDRTEELQKQISKEYIYSDGAGKQGGAVQKIHTIMDTNPNIAHWNIISFHGANSALKGTQEIADYYVASYRNWIDYEFPDADVYLLPQSTMTKNFRLFCKGDKDALNRTLAAAFPDHFIDLMPFFWDHYPQGLMEVDQKVDMVHWSSQTYYEMVSMIIRQIQEKRGANTLDYTVTDVQAVLYTNDATVIYVAPSQNGSVLLQSCEPGLPVLVTGVTDNGYFRVDLGESVGYVPGIGLDEQVKTIQTQ